MQSEATGLLSQLVAIPSVNPMGRALTGPEYFEGRLADFLVDYFRALGVPFERQAVAPGRDNVVAHFESGAARTVLFEAHMDTVPAEKMTVAPFAAHIEGGRLYGRGACDVKGGMASMLTAFARLARDRPAGAANLIMACTVDEEHTFLGVQRLMQDLRADEAVVAEPTGLHIVPAHKGVVRWHIATPGRSCHSSAPEQGVNAIYRMGKLLTAIETFAAQLRQHHHPLLGPPTLSVGRIEGGASVNIVPDHCRIEIDRRLVPGEHPGQVIDQLTQFLRGAGGIDFPFEVSPASIQCPPLSPDGANHLIERLSQAIDTVLGHHVIDAVAYGTDASTIAEAGIPAVVFGPGEIAQAHTCDEWIDLQQLEQAADVYYRFVSGAA